MDSLAPLACDRIAALEAERAQLLAAIAPLQERVDLIDRSLEAVRRALDPEQIALPLPGVGAEAGSKASPRARKLTATNEELLRKALGREDHSIYFGISYVDKGARLSAQSLVRAGLFEWRQSTPEGVYAYGLTPDGEAVARALPVKEGT